MSKLKDNRLYVFNDEFVENGFVVKSSELVFARINKISDKWVVWFYKAHLQKEFPKLKEALGEVNGQFTRYCRGEF